MKEVYLWKVGDRIVYHTNKKAAAQIDGLSRTPDKTITEAQFDAAGGLVRLIDGKIILGKTDQEKADEKAAERIKAIDARFAEIEQKSVRPMLAHIRKKEVKADIDKLAELDAETDALRIERKELEDSLSRPLA